MEQPELVMKFLTVLGAPLNEPEIGPPNRTPYRRGGPKAVEGLKQR